MDVYIFSNNKNIGKSFSGIEKSKEYSLQIVPSDKLKSTAKTAEGGSILYVDISSYQGPEIKKTLNFLSKLNGFIYGILDPRGVVKDVAELFHNGSSDYIGKDLAKGNISPKRLKTIVEFSGIEVVEKTVKKVKKEYALSGTDWNNIKVGQEYSFCFMLIEIDNKKKLLSLGTKHAKETTDIFQEYVKQTVSPINGKIWMWMDFGGLIIFPFNGVKCDAILAASKLMINMKLMSAEHFNIEAMLSYRIALHIGNTVFQKRGDTGSIVSDSINSIFHLGQKFCKAGNFFMTDEIFEYTPNELKDCFTSAGQYEGRDIMKMRLPK